MTMRPLEALEHWMQSAIVRPHEGRARPTAVDEAEAARHVLPSAHLSPAERVDIYAGMYFARLHDVLADEFPAVRALAGAEAFEKLVRAYLRAHPSRHWSLSGLGRALPAFLAGNVRVPRKALLADVARLEDAMSRVFDAASSPLLTPADVGRLAPESFPTARLVCVDAFEVLTLEHRANAIVRSVRQDEPLPSLSRARTWCVVWRKDWVVWRMELDAIEFELLTAIRDGATVGGAIARATERSKATPEAMQTTVSNAFGRWIAEGFFARVDVT